MLHLYERRSAHKQKLQEELLYAYVEEILKRQDPVTKFMKIDPEAILNDYNVNGFITNNDEIIFPAGTIFTWVKTIEPDQYDIYRVSGTQKCYIAVSPRSIIELFGEEPYKEGSLI